MKLIITCPRNLEEETRNEINSLMNEFGDENPDIVITELSGILTTETHLDNFEILKKIKDKIRNEPWSIRYIRRIIPIQKAMNTELNLIKKEALELTKQIKPDETYCIKIEKRNSVLKSEAIIAKIAPLIKNKVSLEEPNRVILIEILGSKTGMSLVQLDDILSIEKLKRSLSE